MLLPRFAVTILGSAMLTACAHGVTTELPTSPGPVPTATTIRSLTVTPQGGGTLIAGGSAPITTSGTTLGLGAWAQYSDGSAKYVPAAWTSSDAQVIAIQGDSIVAIGRGTATLTARFEGMTAAETFTVVPNMTGTWTGTYVVDQCGAGSGSMLELICGDTPGHMGILPRGTAAPMTMTIQKNGADLTATAQFGELRGTLRGTDRGQNFLTLKGDLTVNRTTLTIVYWDTRVRDDLMEGFIGFEVRIDGIPSNAAVTAHLDNVTRR